VRERLAEHKRLLHPLDPRQRQRFAELRIALVAALGSHGTELEPFPHHGEKPVKRPNRRRDLAALDPPDLPGRRGRPTRQRGL
jgi:hypothetical protein